MKRLPLILAAVFLAITLARVATFTADTMSAGSLFGWLFSIGLGVAVYSSAYWTRNQTTRRAAVIALAFFVAIDAFFNFAHVWLSAERVGTLATVGAVLYGLFPTIATALLGWLQTSVNKLPPGAAGAKKQRLEANLYDWLAAKFAPANIPAKEEILPVAESEPEPEFRCGCGYVAKNQNALNAHQRRHAVKVEFSTNGHKPERVNQ